jgi:glycerol-3-phosphate acyltransferase PlsY
MVMVISVIALFGAYFLGSISTAVITAHLGKMQDPRARGSHNPGTMNMLRVNGKVAALLTLLGDVAKGALAVYLGRKLDVHGFMLGLVALSALIGHMFPIFFKFRGGKGVATAWGCLLALQVSVALIVMIVWLVIFILWKYASIASIAATASSVLVMILLGNKQYIIPTLLIAILVIYRHHDNIGRLVAGKENKINI